MTKNGRRGWAAAVAAAALGASLAPAAADAQPQPKIDGFTYAGSGCPAGSAGQVYDAESGTLTLSFDRFMTELPPGLSKACNVTFVVRVPPGYQMSLHSVEYMGYIDSTPGVHGRLARRYKYGNSPPKTFVTRVEPGRGDFYVVDENITGWSACGRQVTLATNARIDLQGDPRSGTSEMVLDAAQYDTEVVYTFALKTCR